MGCVTVTEHGGKRIRERVGVSKNMVQKNAELALEKGLTHAELAGAIKRYVSYLWHQNEVVNGIRVYCHYVYLFKGSTLITVLPLPQKYRKQADALAKRKKEHDLETNWKQVKNVTYISESKKELSK